MNVKVKSTTKLVKPQAPRFVIGMEWVEEPVLTERKRDIDGRFLKQNCSLNTKPIKHNAENIAIAERYGVSADELFAA